MPHVVLVKHAIKITTNESIQPSNVDVEVQADNFVLNTFQTQLHPLIMWRLQSHFWTSSNNNNWYIRFFFWVNPNSADLKPFFQNENKKHIEN